MTVNRCNRNGCENIRCERYNETYGYICNGCFEELVEKGVRTNIDFFMASSKDKNLEREEKRAMKYFDDIFQER